MLGFSGTRQWVYPRSVRGHYQRLHRVSGILLQVLLVGLPWLRIGGHPAVRVDLPSRRVHLFGTILSASDGYLLVLMGLLATFSLFLFTSLYGRLWCGYGCPQTVFLEEWVRPIERLVEGERMRRMRRDKSGWTLDRAWRKGVKWALFAAVAVFVSMSFQSWFAGAPEIWLGQAGPWDYGLVAFFSTAWFLDFAWFREQMCNYVCPYARFQGALCDDESLVVAYDEGRGEPRNPKTGRELGNCVDCDLCVDVCPQGIDIREGFQLECITCARCVDACTHVQGKLGHPSLITYTTLADTEGRKPRLLRARTVAYGGLLTAVAAGIVGILATHAPFEAHVQRAPGTLYTVDDDGWTRNTYLLRLTNNDPDEAPDRFAITLEGLDDADLTVPELVLAPEESRTVPLIVRLPPDAHPERTIHFHVHVATEGGVVRREATFKSAHPITSRNPEG